MRLCPSGSPDRRQVTYQCSGVSGEDVRPVLDVLPKIINLLHHSRVGPLFFMEVFQLAEVSRRRYDVVDSGSGVTDVRCHLR